VYYVLVAGTGETSRANIEALMEDYYYANGDGGVLVLAYKDAPSRSQTYVAQYAVDCKKDIIIFCREGAKTAGIPNATVNFVNFPYSEATAFLEGQGAIAQILWNSEDTAENTDIVQACTDRGISAYNLCDGLLPLSVTEKTPEDILVKNMALVIPEPKETMQNADDFRTDLLKTVQGVQSMLDLLVKKING
jgi:hypothetical protein